MTREEKLERAGDYALGLMEGAERQAFEAELARDPELAALTAEITRRLQALDDTAVAEASPGLWTRVEQRLARTLLRLMEKAGRPTAAGIEIDFPITRQDLAEMAGFRGTPPAESRARRRRLTARRAGLTYAPLLALFTGEC